MELCLAHLGFRDYQTALDLQRKLWELRVGNYIPDALLLVEHDHVITLGKSADRRNLLLPAHQLIALGMPVYEVERGGDCTYHGPGQVVGYPILKLQNARGTIAQFVARLEEVMIKTLDGFGITSRRRAGLPGAWTGQNKIGSLGVAVRRWVTFHGFALNVNTELSRFGFIKPCGQDWTVMTSMEQILGHEVDMAEVTGAVSRHFVEIFEAKVISRSVEDIAQTGLAVVKFLY